MLLPFLPAFILVPFVLLKPNRRPKAWIVLVPFCLIAAVMLAGQQLPVNAIATVFAEAYPFVVMLASSLCLLCLISYAFPGWSAARKFLAITGLYLLPGMLILFFLYAGSELQSRILASLYGLAPLFLLVSFILSGRRCRNHWHLGRFTLWFLPWNFILLFVGMLLLFGILVIMQPMPSPWWSIVLPLLAITLLFEFILFLIAFPFVLTVFLSPLYRERLMAIFKVEPPPPEQPVVRQNAFLSDRSAAGPDPDSESAPN